MLATFGCQLTRLREATVHHCERCARIELVRVRVFTTSSRSAFGTAVANAGAEET